VRAGCSQGVVVTHQVGRFDSKEKPDVFLWSRYMHARRCKQAESHNLGLERRIREHEARAADLERGAKEGDIRAADAEGRGKLAEVCGTKIGSVLGLRVQDTSDGA